MKKLISASIGKEEIIGAANGWYKLWSEGDLNTIKIVDETAGGHVNNADVAYEIILRFTQETMKGTVWMNDKYQVIARDHGDLTHLSIKRLDKSPLERDWRDYQQIKNELIGEECEAIELFPAESRMVDNANQFHLWGWSDGRRVPVGWNERMVSCTPLAGAQQRPFETEGA